MENRRIITFFVLVWRVLLTAGSQRCNMDLCTSPDMANSSGLYELQLSSQEYSTTENGKMQISVQVKMTTCPSLQSPGVKYYKLQSYSNSSMEPAGTFNEPQQLSEAELCSNNVVVFSSCEPSVTDLPRTYGWNAPASYVGDICFRLTILTESDDDENSCEEIIECISPDATAPTRSPDEDEGVVVPAPDEILTVVDLSNFGTQDNKHVENCHKRRNCTNAKLKTMCASDGKEYPSRCHVKLEACLSEIKLDIVHPGECPPSTATTSSEPITTPSPPPTGPCIDERQIIMNSPVALGYGWIPSCDCNGNFKPIQCNTVTGECWCSTIRGHLRGQRQRFCEQRTDFSHCLLS